MMKCIGCIWSTRISAKKMFCLFPKCVKERMKADAEEAKETVQLSRMPGAGSRKVLRNTSKGNRQKV